MNRTFLNHMLRSAAAAAAVVVLMLAGPAGLSAAESDTEYTTDDCIACHQTGSEDSDLHMSVEAFKASAHSGEVECQECHTGVVDDEHQSVEGSGAVDCTACHDQENQHGLKGQAEARPQCYSCHSRHNILAKDDPASTVHPDRLAATCGECHTVETDKKSYFSWFPSMQISSHAKGDFGVAYKDDNCLGCHQGAGAHGEEEPINDQSCYKCHFSPELDGAMWGRIHPEANIETQPAVFAAASIYQVCIIVGLLMLVGRLFRRRSAPTGGKTDSVG